MVDDEEPESKSLSKAKHRLNRLMSRSVEGKLKKAKDTSFNENDLVSSGYSTIKDNKLFNRFAIKYNEALTKAFDEADKQANLSGKNSSATLKNDCIAYLDKHSEIRKLMKDDMLKNATPIG